MAAYRFSWDAFKDNTVAALAEAWGYDPDEHDGGARAWLGENVKRPHPEFIRATKDVLVTTWLSDYRGAKHIVERLIDAGVGPMGAPRAQSGYVAYIGKCRNSKRLRQYLLEAMLRFGDRDRVLDEDDVEFDFVPRFSILTPAKQPADGRSPHSYQVEAWDKLRAHNAEAEATGSFQGLLVMPTGSGKTFTAVHWLLKNVIARGGRVLWLAHRHELLTHAGAEFQRLAELARPKERLRVRIVSGAHCATTQIDPADDVVVASVASLARRPEIAGRMIEDKRLFVVVDEAHHAPAKSYRDIIDNLKQQKTWRILGLTATPTRTMEGERPILGKLFGDRILFQVGLRQLIEQGTLARPIPVHVKTKAEVEEGVTEDDQKHYRRFGDISEEWLDRIAKLTQRNKVIVDHYLQHKDKYGRTLIFAINVHHAALLAKDLQDRGVRADYVASYRPDETDGDPMTLMQRFRDGELDVLVNVQMVTEGVDVPKIQTVFLTRPTASEILIRQMIGRGMRGEKAGGTKDVYLVSFQDHWNRFRDWESPFDLVPDVVTPSGVEAGEKVPSREIIDTLELLPWDVIRSVSNRMREVPLGEKADVFEAIPHGWLVLEREDDGDGIRTPIAIYKHQRPCWDALIKRLESVSTEARDALDPDALYADYFGDCDLPVPSPYDVGKVVAHYQLGGDKPDVHDLEGRKKCDPHEVARQIHDGDLRAGERRELVAASYTSLAKAIYPDLREYRAAIEDALFEVENPDEATQRQLAEPIFDPRPDQQLAPGPTHDLAALMPEVLHTGAGLLGVPELKHVGPLEWTKRILKGWYAFAYWKDHTAPATGRIRVNCLLDSPDVSQATIRFLLWHEYLHLHLKQLHTPTFRELEKKWPNYNDAWRELFNLNEKFGVQYW